MAESVGGLCQECLQTEVTEFTPKIPPPPEPSTRPDDSFPAEPSGVTVTHTPTPPPADAPTVNYRVGRWPGLPPAPPGFELVRRLGSGGRALWAAPIMPDRAAGGQAIPSPGVQ